MWLSYIIPLYNCEAYISSCLDSILRQGLEEDEYEVIVVNDGSTDRGKDIIEAYCRKHANFRLINKGNGGVSSARNAGIEAAKGDYIHFMDSDDRLVPNGMQVLRDCYLRKFGKTDMIAFYSHTVDRYYKPEVWEHIHSHQLLFHGTFAEYSNQYGFKSSACFQIISRQVIMVNNLRFSAYRMGEDVLFMMRLFAITNAVITATDLNIYRYYVRNGSSVTTIERKHLEEAYSGFIAIYKEILLLQESSTYKKTLFEKVIWSFQRHAFIRMLSGAFPYTQVKRLLSKAIATGFYPITNTTTRFQKFINFIIRCPVVVFLMSVPFRYVFILYIKPWMHRN